MTELTGRRSECDVLDRLVAAVRAGESRALVVHGEPGVGKTALLEYLAAQAPGCRVARAGGVQSEMELAFAVLHQLCAPMLDRLERLPAPQRDALRTAFGLSAGPAPDRFLIGLAVLGLLSEMAGDRPLVCIVDDEQWLDSASAQVLAFVARRLGAESLGLVFGARVPTGDLAGLPELVIGGLRENDARALLDSALTGPLDARVRDQIIAEAHGNPLALLELPRGLTAAELAGGFGLPGAVTALGQHRGELPAPARHAADPDPAAAAAGGGRSDRRSGAGVAGGRTAGHRLLRRRGPRSRPAWPSSGPGCGSVIRWCARWPTGRHLLRSGSWRTRRWRRPPTGRSIPTAAPGTGPRPLRGRMRTSPRSWSARPAGRGHAAGWPRRPHSWSAPRC